MTAPADVLVLFGATGDLAYKKIYPALHELVRRGRLNVPVVGVAKEGWGVEQLRERARASVTEHGKLDESAFARLCSLLHYVDGDYRDPATFARLRQAIGAAQRPLHYLAIPPSLFATVAEGLARSGCAQNARLVVEKPFGRDLASAQQLNRVLHAYFPEDAIYRIDHYLGKEPVQSVVYFRFANHFIGAAWSHRLIESVQITMAENFGVAGRGKFYEEVGAIRDVLQNHLFQVLACVTMECPLSRKHQDVRDARARVLCQLRPLTPEDVVRGQFRGYRQEPGVAPQSQVETFIAVRCWIENERWKGVPFYIRAGKCLPVTVTEVLLRFYRPPRPVLDEREPPLANYYRFRLTPDLVLALGTKVKQAGEAMVGERIELVAHHHPPDEMDPYERLLGDAMRGDGELFAREDGVEAAWRALDSILGNVTPVYEYEPGTWGPAEADRLTADHGGWHNPTTELSPVQC